MSQPTLNLPIEKITPPSAFNDDLRTWLAQEAQKRALPWLLAHSDDGVNWGKVESARLLISHDYFADLAPPLLAETLQQVRLFGPEGELLLWPIDGQWQGRFLAETAAGQTLTTHYLLWGDRCEQKAADNFLLLAEGAEGLRHGLPFPVEGNFDPQTQRVALQIEHYLAYDDDGQAYIAASRLHSLSIVSRNKE